MFEEDSLTYKIIGCAMKVHTVLGCGFQEVIYQRCLAKELGIAGLTFEREKEMEIYYNNEMVGIRRVDFLIENEVLVEIKAVGNLEDVHLVQGKNYLKVFDLDVGLLINFGSTSLETKRLFK